MTKITFTAAAVTAVSLCAGVSIVFYMQTEDYEYKKTLFFADKEDKHALQKLHRISKAARIVFSEFNKIESRTATAITSTDRSVVQLLTSDLDFIFAELDALRGGPVVKIKRKEMAESLRTLYDRVDVFSSIIAKK
jgi:uncharacterized protein YfcZ (UPF0381/DUF406 family)